MVVLGGLLLHVNMLPQYMVLILINGKDYGFQTILNSITTTLVKRSMGSTPSQTIPLHTVPSIHPDSSI